MARDARFPFKAYQGELGHEERRWPIRFQIAHGVDGELRFLVRPFPYISDTAEISRIWHRQGSGAPYFTLRGVAKDGVSFHSDHMTITRMGTTTTANRTTIAPRLHCSKGTFRSTPDQTVEKRFLRWLLRGFESFPSVRAECRIGVVQMAGNYPGPKSERMSGHLQIMAPDKVPDIGQWRTDAEALCLHLQRYMSFAQARMIRAPVQQLWDGEIYEETIWSQPRRRRSAQSVIHPMTQQAYFERAVAAFFDPPIPVRNPTYALEWFAMDAGYTETRLLNAITALENLTNSNLADEDLFFLPQKQFDDLARAMRRTVRAQTSSGETQGTDPGGVADFLAALPGKMRDLNRRPLKAKIRILARRWNVPLHDLLVDGGLTKAVTARDTIVHRGWYYEPVEGSTEARDLWDHVSLMREIVIRFVLTTLAYEGDYLSFRGRQHTVAFPPPKQDDNK